MFLLVKIAFVYNSLLFYILCALNFILLSLMLFCKNLMSCSIQMSCIIIVRYYCTILHWTKLSSRKPGLICKCILNKFFLSKLHLRVKSRTKSKNLKSYKKPFTWKGYSCFILRLNLQGIKHISWRYFVLVIHLFFLLFIFVLCFEVESSMISFYGNQS